MITWLVVPTVGNDRRPKYIDSFGVNAYCGSVFTVDEANSYPFTGQVWIGRVFGDKKRIDQLVAKKDTFVVPDDVPEDTIVQFFNEVLDQTFSADEYKYRRFRLKDSAGETGNVPTTEKELKKLRKERRKRERKTEKERLKAKEKHDKKEKEDKDKPKDDKDKKDKTK